MQGQIVFVKDEILRERAAAVGGAFDVGPTDAGGWQVRFGWPRVGEEDS